jgi:hypothetical protein
MQAASVVERASAVVLVSVAEQASSSLVLASPPDCRLRHRRNTCPKM